MATRAAKLALRGKALTDTGTEIGIVNNADATAITINTAGNVGIGLTPETDWHSSKDALQLGAGASIYGDTTATGNQISANARATLGSSLNGYKYISTDKASTYQQYDGQHNFRVAASGSADAAISWNTAMTINNAGNVGIGSSSPVRQLEIKDDGTRGQAIVGIIADAGDPAGIFMGTTSNNNVGGIRYFTDTNKLALRANDEDRLLIDSAGIVTKPYQPAFSACLGTSHTFAVGTTKIVFNSEIFDQNSDFNASAATFTAPVTGKYQFNISIRIDNMDQGASYYRLKLITSNGDYQPVIIGPGSAFNSDLAYYFFTLPVLADMDAGDTALVQFQVNGGAAQAQIHASRQNANFSGYLVA